MTRSTNATESGQPLTRAELKRRAKNDRQKAAWLRGKAGKGEDLKPDQLAFLNAYEARQGRPPVDAPADAAAPTIVADPAGGVVAEPIVPHSDQAPATPPATGVSSPTPIAPAPAPAAPPRIAPAPPAPPRLESAGGLGFGGLAPSGDWRERYRKGRGGDGREAVCRWGARHWQGVLRALSLQIKESGADPVIDVNTDDFECMLVLALDDLLPGNFKLTPPIEAAVSSTLLLGQRAVRGKALKEARATAAAAARISGGGTVLRSVPVAPVREPDTERVTREAPRESDDPPPEMAPAPAAPVNVRPPNDAPRVPDPTDPKSPWHRFS